MTEQKTAPYGSWKSPITTDLILAQSIGIGGTCWDGEDIYWVEGRPSEGGRNVIVKLLPNQGKEDVTPQGFNVRTRVHEYGGGSSTIYQGTVYFSNFLDQCLYQQKVGNTPEPLTPEGEYRYADAVIDPQRNRLICVREDHTSGGEPTNTIVSINLENGETILLAEGDDFYASPALSPDGSQLCWITWNHPNMPWDGTQLWVAQIQDDGLLGEPQLIAGGLEESIFQPQWSPDGVLYFVSDRSNWWNLYRYQNGEIESLYPMEAEFGLPQWVFGMSTYGFSSAEQIICTYTQAGNWYLACLNTQSKQLKTLESPYTSISSIQVSGNNVLLIGGSPTEPSSLVKFNVETGDSQILQRSSPVELDAGYFSIPQPIEFPTENGKTAYGFFYPPQNKDYTAPPQEKPPLIVKSHGGPTASTSSSFSLRMQYWTSRGFAVLDVNYGGSTGYGREYRQRLKDRWGIVDVDDCTNGAKYLAQQGLVDGDRMAITGGSAGGYTTLCALTFKDVFKAGASYYGVSDLEALATDTHKFESRYLDGLIGPYPERKDLYIERSPIHYIDQLACPVIFFQGLEDKIVPPNQAELMVEALKAKGILVEYVAFEGEQHGFRKAENIKRCLEDEYSFYAKVFGFEAVL